MKKIIKTLIAGVLLTSTISFARGVDSSGGSDSFVNVVKTLQPLGRSYIAAEESLLQQGFKPQSEVTVTRKPSLRSGIDIFTIRQLFGLPACPDCQPVVVVVKGQLRNNIPTGNETDVFQIDGVFVGH